MLFCIVTFCWSFFCGLAFIALIKYLDDKGMDRNWKKMKEEYETKES